MSLFISNTFLAQQQLWPPRRDLAQSRRKMARKAKFQQLLKEMVGVLTPNERSAVAHWSHGHLAKEWNAQLISGKVTSPEVPLILSAFQKMCAPEDMTTYAGMNAPTPQRQPWPLEQAGFTATSLSPVVALGFADPGYQVRYDQSIQWRAHNATQLGIVRIPKGHPILIVNGRFTELEVLLPPNLTVQRSWMHLGSEPEDHRSVAMYQLI